MDYKRKFVEAAQKYNELSLKSRIDSNKRFDALEKALICAILAPAGPQRSRMLGTLFKDERSQDSKAYSMLNKMSVKKRQVFCFLIFVVFLQVSRSDYKSSGCTTI